LYLHQGRVFQLINSPPVAKTCEMEDSMLAEKILQLQLPRTLD